MLHVRYGRETVDKAKYIFENAGTGSYVLVPDQFTLEAEREAFRVLGRDGISDPEIMSISRLGFRMLSETGGTKRRRLDAYGRYILLSSVAEELAEAGELKTYGKVISGRPVIEMLSDFISGIKQRGVTVSDLCGIRDEEERETPGSMLSSKLSDLCRIYEKYEERLSGCFVDAEDAVEMYIAAAASSGLVKSHNIWVWGFDTFTPKNRALLEELARYTEVYVVMTSGAGGRDGELFELTRAIISKFREEMPGTDVSQIGDEYAMPTVGPGMLIESELFAIPAAVKPADGVTLAVSANCYSEADRAAAYVTRLVRDKGLRYRDILLICNDTETRGRIIKRVFAQYGISVFMDEKRGIMYHPAVVFTLALMDTVANDYRSMDVFRLLKTGLTPISADDAADLENYAAAYRIRGGMWKKPFKYGRDEYGEDFDRIEGLRAELYGFTAKFEKAFKAERAAKSRIAALCEFLTDEAHLPEKLKDMADDLYGRGMPEAASETAQIWDALIGIFDQIVNITGEGKPSMETLAGLLKTGLSAVETGVLPPAKDGLILGTTQRTRSGHIRALVVLGANDGLLPRESVTEEILSDDEKASLEARGFELASRSDVRVNEEKLAIYRTFSHAGEYLYVSYPASGPDGSEAKPSRIFGSIQGIFADAKLGKDGENALDMIECREAALGHLIEELREASDPSALSDEWRALASWFSENDSEAYTAATAGLFYKHGEDKLNRELADSLYRRRGGEFVLSPSRLERYSRCPFMYFVQYGLGAQERRIFEAGSREIGDVYHEVIMKYSKHLTENKLWDKIARAESDELISMYADEEAEKYKEGLLQSGDEESYRARRMKETLSNAAWALVSHVRSGDVAEMHFEEGFGKEREFPAIEVQTSGGKITIEGRIDRVDILANGTVKIIDYKSGNEAFKADEARSGWRLQLMLYLEAATGDFKEKAPAGVFYFKIKDADIDANGKSAQEITEKLEKEIIKSFKMNGLVVNSSGTVEAVTGTDFDGQYSQVVTNLKLLKDGIYKGSVIMPDEFDELARAFRSKVRELCESLASGYIAAEPKKNGAETPCEYCGYKGICRIGLKTR